MPLPPDDRRCTEVGRDGERCKAWAVKGAERQLCAGHAGLGVAASPDAARAAQKVATRRRREVAEERPRSYRETLQRAWEENAADVVARRMEIIRNGSDADALRAIEAMENRIYGRATERVEVEATGPSTVDAVRLMPLEERRALLARVVLPAVPDVELGPDDVREL